jgi:3-hydroxyacyl-[acyl-carrier-protein] dehydratase
MLNNDFYFVVDKNLTNNGFDANIALNENHTIYRSHFPQKPITPGICILQIAKELIASHHQKTLVMDTIRNIKFLQIIDPLINHTIHFSIATNMIDNNLIKANVVVESGSTCFTKISIIYKIV